MDEFDLMYADELALLEEAENDFAGLNVRYRYVFVLSPTAAFFVSTLSIISLSNYLLRRILFDISYIR